MELVSIIVPVYNVEKYLNKCIDSIISQTYKNIEIILVDDGSIDNSPQICDKYANSDARITVIHKVNGGLSDARNKGLDIAAGDYIAFIDSDDYISADMIETLYKRLKKDGTDLALCNYLCVDETYNEISGENRLAIIDEVLRGNDALDKLHRDGNWYYVIACNKLYKRELFDEIRFPVGKIHEDEFVIHHIFGKCNKISCIKQPMYFYIKHSGSITTSSFSIKKLDVIEAFYDRAQFFINKGMSSNALICVNKALSLSKQYIIQSNKDRQIKERISEIKKNNRKPIITIFLRSNFKHKAELILMLINVNYNRFFKIISGFRRAK